MIDGSSGYLADGFDYKGIGVLQTNKIHPVFWLKKHHQENPGIILIPVENKENMYIRCEIKNYKVLKMETIQDGGYYHEL